MVKEGEKDGDDTTETATDAALTKKVNAAKKKNLPPKGVCRFFFKFGKCERKKSACPMEHPNGKKTGEFSYVKDENATENDESKDEETEVEGIKNLELLDEPTENAEEEKNEDVDMQLL